MLNAERLQGTSDTPDTPCVTVGVTVEACSYCGEPVRLLDLLVAVTTPDDADSYSVWHLRCARERSLFDLAFPTA